ncbi:DUF2791 family P-loop domain-containing protein [Nocardioides sp. LHD-245]|uniref:ATP-binding protein n=1 Tax=Nocardioides sp. LHD-245 TaxID=3051387 RepID=UPI0027DF9D6F|nr:DUF2791 family P-loop domain-containing protein [Nocardioides sp. LHD-245]
MTVSSSPSRRRGAFAAVLRRLREAAGLTQAELAERSGIGVRTVSNLERGINASPYPSTIRLLADALAADGPARAELLRAARREPGSEGRRVAPTGGYLGALPLSPMVGRDREGAVLSTALSAVAEGDARVVLLAGEPGIGKTRLAQEMSRYAAERAFLVAVGRCHEPLRATPFAPMLDVVGALHAGLEPETRDVVVDRWPPLVTLLPDRFPTATPAGPGPDAAQRLHRAVAGLVRQVAEDRPVAILVDDLHWADVATVELFTHLARHSHGSRVLLLGTYRDTEVGGIPLVRRLGRELRREGLVEIVPVGRLDRDATAQLITDRLAEDTVSEEVTTLVHRQTDGNPFFVVETVAALVERGDLAHLDGGSTGRDATELVVPASVSEAIGERVARLSAAAQRLLNAGSVLGELFDADDLPVSDADDEALEETLDEAVDSGLLTIAEGRYAFSHSLTRQTLYAALSPARRRRLHRQVGDGLAMQPPVHRRRAAEIARHLEAGAAPDRAVPFLLLAGAVAAELHASQDALRHYRRALELAGELGDGAAATAALEGIGQAELTTAAYDDAVDHLARAADDHRRRGDVGGQLRAEGLLAQAQYRRGEGEVGAFRLAEIVAEIDGRSGPDGQVTGLAAMHVGLARVRLALGQRAGALAASEHATRLARAEGAVAVEADADAVRGTSLLFLDRPDDAVTALERAVELARRVDAVTVESGALLALQWTLTMRGELDRARVLGARGVEVTRRSGDTDAEALHLANVGLTAFYGGDLAGAERHLETSVELARAGSRTLFSGIPPAYLGLLRSAQGDRVAALACFDDAAGAPNLKTFEFAAYIEARRAGLDLADGRPGPALSRLEPWLSVEAPTRIHDVMLQSTAAAACLELGDLDRAHLLVARAVRRAEATRNVIDGGDARGLADRVRRARER